MSRKLGLFLIAVVVVAGCTADYCSYTSSALNQVNSKASPCWADAGYGLGPSLAFDAGAFSYSACEKALTSSACSANDQTTLEKAAGRYSTCVTAIPACKPPNYSSFSEASFTGPTDFANSLNGCGDELLDAGTGVSATCLIALAGAR